MNNMRDIINLVESAEISEAGFVSRMANKGLSKLGNKKAQGRSTKDALTKRLKDNYYRWLGKTNKDGTLSDIQNFLKKVNFTNEQINLFTKQIVTYIEQNPEQAKEQNTENENNSQTTESVINELNANDFVLSRSEVDTIMDTASAYAFENGLYDTNSNNASKEASNNQGDGNTGKQETITRTNLFTQPVMNMVNDLGVRTRDIPDMFDYSKNVKFDQLDNDVKDNLAKIGYTLLRYNKTGLQ